MVEDSGFDSARLLFAKAEERDAWARDGRVLEFVTKWNPRKQDRTAWVKRAEEANAFEVTRPGKRVGLLDLQVERAWQKQKRTFRLIVRVTERTIDKKGQHLLVPDIEIEGWWTSLTLPAVEVIEHYRYHGTHEQFHAEIKSDLDLERLPSGKFDTNDVILHLGAFAYNCLRLLGQLGLTGEIAPIRHPAKRRRLKTVLQESCTGRRSLWHMPENSFSTLAADLPAMCRCSSRFSSDCCERHRHDDGRAETHPKDGFRCGGR